MIAQRNLGRMKKPKLVAYAKSVPVRGADVEKMTKEELLKAIAQEKGWPFKPNHRDGRRGRRGRRS